MLYGSSGLPQWRVGDKQSLSKSWSREEVEAFSKLSLDDNKIHLDPEFAAKTPFKKCIVHGMLTASLISAVLGTKLPGKVIELPFDMKYFLPFQHLPLCREAFT